VSLLHQLGYPARLRTVPSVAALAPVADSRTKAQVVLVAWFAAFPAASQYIKTFLSCKNFIPNSTGNLNQAEFCNRQLENQIDNALAAEEVNSPAASALWAQADKTVTNDAPLVPLVIPPTIDFVSHRVGNYQASPWPFGTVLIDQLWVK
jgi:ABC-type transport system substrate-binding protein